MKHQPFVIRPRPSVISRGRFLHTSLIGLAAMAASRLSHPLSAAESGAPFRGLKLGVASYSFRKFSLDQAIAMTIELGLSYIGLKSVHLEFDSTPEQLRAAASKIRAAGLTLLGGGVVYFRTLDEKEIRSVFAYAKAAEMPTLVCSPVPASLDFVEKMAVEYDIVVAIHNHGPGDKHYPLPLDAWRMVEGRDRRMGICIDVGHTLRVGGDPIAAIRRCAPRLYDFHLKDLSSTEVKAENVVFGRGVVDIPRVLRTLLEVGFSGHLQIEYEATPDDPLPGMKASVEYLRKISASL